MRLTMGGEPTFVSIDDMDGEEWNTAAMGPNKLRLAANCWIAFATNSRPADCCTSVRASGIRENRCRAGPSPATGAPMDMPLWHDPELVGDPGRDYGYTDEEAQRFAEGTGGATVGWHGISSCTAYEDPLAYVLKERDLPVNVDPVDNKLDDPEERERLAPRLQPRTRQTVGFVLPLQRAYGKERSRMANRPVDAACATSVSGARRFSGGLASAA